MLKKVKLSSFSPLQTSSHVTNVSVDIDIYYLKYVPFRYSCLGARDT